MSKPAAAPSTFRHALDPALFALPRLEALVADAPAGTVTAQPADRALRRAPGGVPLALVTPLGEFLRREAVQVQFGRLERWAPSFLAPARHVLHVAGFDADALYDVRLAVRLFSPGVLLAFHAHGETPVDCVVTGACTWHLHDAASLSAVQHESLHRGGQFGLPLPERQAAHRIALAAGEGVVAPARWPHWVEYGEAEPTVTFEVEFWTRESLRERKVYDTNWALRRAGLEPTPPGRSRARDGAKTRAFDAVARLTGRGRNLVGRPGLRVDGG